MNLFKVRERVEHFSRQKLGFVQEKVPVHRESVRGKICSTGVRTSPINSLTKLSL